MKIQFLFPHYFRVIGFILAIPGFLLGILFLFFHYTIPGFGPDGGEHFKTTNTNTITGVRTVYSNYLESCTNELALTLVIVGLLFITFSKLKREDELTARIRLNALYWAILISYLVLFIGSVSIFIDSAAHNWYERSSNSLGFGNILDINLIMPLVIFILRFYYLLYNKKDAYYMPTLRFLPYQPFNKTGKILSLICIVIVGPGTIYLRSLPIFSELRWWMDYLYMLYYVMPFILLLWVYSKEQKEDEYISSIRLNAMQIAIYVNYGILLIANFLFFELDFLTVETYNISTILLIFILVFQFQLYRLSKQTDGKRNNTVNLNIL